MSNNDKIKNNNRIKTAEKQNFIGWLEEHKLKYDKDIYNMLKMSLSFEEPCADRKIEHANRFDVGAVIPGEVLESDRLNAKLLMNVLAKNGDVLSVFKTSCEYEAERLGKQTTRIIPHLNGRGITEMYENYSEFYVRRNWNIRDTGTLVLLKYIDPNKVFYLHDRNYQPGGKMVCYIIYFRSEVFRIMKNLEAEKVKYDKIAEAEEAKIAKVDEEYLKAKEARTLQYTAVHDAHLNCRECNEEIRDLKDINKFKY